MNVFETFEEANAFSARPIADALGEVITIGRMLLYNAKDNPKEFTCAQVIKITNIIKHVEWKSKTYVRKTVTVKRLDTKEFAILSNLRKTILVPKAHQVSASLDAVLDEGTDAFLIGLT